jgi:hypothetical protein
LLKHFGREVRVVAEIDAGQIVETRRRCRGLVLDEREQRQLATMRLFIAGER